MQSDVFFKIYRRDSFWGKIKRNMVISHKEVKIGDAILR